MILHRCEGARVVCASFLRRARAARSVEGAQPSTGARFSLRFRASFARAAAYSQESHKPTRAYCQDWRKFAGAFQQSRAAWPQLAHIGKVPGSAAALFLSGSVRSAGTRANATPQKHPSPPFPAFPPAALSAAFAAFWAFVVPVRCRCQWVGSCAPGASWRVCYLICYPVCYSVCYSVCLLLASPSCFSPSFSPLGISLI